MKSLLDLFRKLSPVVSTKGQMLSEASKNHALNVLEKHGMSAQFYLAGVDHRENQELSSALDIMQAAGCIIVNDKGEIVGKFAKVRLSSSEKAEYKRSKFKVVNT